MLLLVSIFDAGDHRPAFLGLVCAWNNFCLSYRRESSIWISVAALAAANQMTPIALYLVVAHQQQSRSLYKLLLTIIFKHLHTPKAPFLKLHSGMRFQGKLDLVYCYGFLAAEPCLIICA